MGRPTVKVYLHEEPRDPPGKNLSQRTEKGVTELELRAVVHGVGVRIWILWLRMTLPNPIGLMSEHLLMEELQKIYI